MSAARKPSTRVTLQEHTVALHQRGESAPAIASRLGVSLRTVWRWLDDAGLARDRRPQAPEHVREEAVRRVLAGESRVAVARDMGIPKINVERWVRAHTDPHDEPWKPGTWVHPIRRRALGLA